MPKPNETKHEYNIPKLNKIFAISSGLLLICFVLILWFDWHWGSLPLLGTQADRQWKIYQIQYNEVERAKAELDQRNAKIIAETKGLDTAAKAVKDAASALASRQSVLKEIETELSRVNAALFIVTRKFQEAKGLLDQCKSQYELALEEAHRDTQDKHALAAAKILQAQQDLVASLDQQKQKAEAEQKAVETRRNAELAESKARAKDLDRLQGDFNLISRKLSLLSDPVIQKGLAAPLVELAASPLKYNQIVLEKHVTSVNFANVPRVDRCTTCHVGISASEKQGAFFTVDSLEGIGGTLTTFNKSNLKPLIDLAASRKVVVEKKAESAEKHDGHEGTHAAAPSAQHPASVSHADIRAFVEKAASKKSDAAVRLEGLVERTFPVLTKGEFEQIAKTLENEGIALLDAYRALPQPLKPHPHLDLFVGPDSPHPVEKFGCSVCHHGSDRDLNFGLVGHTPDEHEKRAFVFDAEFKRWIEPSSYVRDGVEKLKKAEMTQHEAWVKNYQWAEDHYNEWPMRPTKFIEASCLKCHANQTEIPHAAKLTKGLRLIEQLGCWSCHKMKQVESYASHKIAVGEDLASVARLHDVSAEDVNTLNNLAPGVELKPGKEIQIPIRTLSRTGPNLTKVASKTNPDWVRKWLADPTSFRPDTMMPRFWGHGNTGESSVYTDPYLKDESGKPLVIKTADRNAVEIAAITDYLFALSDKPTYPAPSVKGEAEKGRALVTQLGCFACHMVTEPKSFAAKFKKADAEEEEEDEDKAREEANLNKALREALHDVPEQFQRFRSQGPTLFGVGSKADANWLHAWLKNPKQYHSKTRMPNLRLTDQEAADVTAYLMALNKEETDKQALPVVASEAAQSVVVEYLETGMTHADATERFKNNRFDDMILDYFATGEIATWVKDATAMEARQKQVEAALSSADALLKQAQDDVAIAKARTALADATAEQKKFEAQTAQVAAMRERMDSLTPDQKRNVYLGGKLIARYGCYACHSIKGFENAKPIGTELSDWGSKEIAKLDFGLLSEKEVPRTRYAYITQKLLEPRSYDEGKFATLNEKGSSSAATKSPQEWLKMPKFHLTPDQIEAIATAVNGMTGEPVLPDEPQQLTRQQQDIERGRWLVKELNCYGCHLIEDKGWAIRTAGVDGKLFHGGDIRWSAVAKEGVLAEAMEPPLLTGGLTQLHQGSRTNPDWLFGFLKAPTTGLVRPWLKSRMPTFDLTDAEANVLVRYFAAQAKEQFPYKAPHPLPSAEKLALGKEIFDGLKCNACHIVEGKFRDKPLAQVAPEMFGMMAPPFALSHDRLQREWMIEKWLPKPSAQVPGTKMPQFDWGPDLIKVKAADGSMVSKSYFNDDPHQQREALVDYILSLGAKNAAPAAEKE